MPRSISNKASIRRTASSAKGRYYRGLFALQLAARILRQYEERSSGMDPACVRTIPGKEEECDLKPFIVTQGVQRLPGKGGARQPEARSCMGDGNVTREA
jgi:hypothetical protein